MPIYEFYCPDNHRIYSFFARSLSHAGRIPRCPDNPDFTMEKRLSGFAITGRTREKGEDSHDDPRLEAAMAEMEREMSGLDENNPDPRQLGRMMRRMSEMAGDAIPPQMEEMIGRMEAGEDIEKLEEEFGDMDETMDDFGAGDGEGAPGDAARKTLRRLARKLPSRDPRLYEMTDYL